MRRLALASALLTVSASLAAIAHADQVRRSPGTHRFVTTDSLVSVLDGPDDTHVTTIDTRLYVPDNATPRTPQPALLMTHGFGLTKLSEEVAESAKFFARHGYVLSHVAPTDLVLFGKVYDVAPDGTATLIHRLISPIRIPSAALGRPVDVKLLGFAHRFAKGHRVRLTLATTDTTAFNNPVPDVITVTPGPGTSFTLPFRKA